MVDIISTNQTDGDFNPRTVASLFKHSIENMLNRWNESRPLRTGMPHASNILAPDHEYCLRKLVLMAHYPESAEKLPAKPWDAHTNAIFLNGWTLHEKYQDLFLKFGARVVYFDGDPNKPELDFTHFDPDRLLYFSPDAIVEFCRERMVVEIKGYKSESFQKMDEAGPAPEAAHLQVNFYLHLLELKHGLVLVEDKNTQYFKVWCVPYNRELVQPYLDRMYRFRVALHKAETNQGLPERVCNSQKDRNAEKCSVCKLCFKMK
jgi:hypothetical protein